MAETNEAMSRRIPGPVAGRAGEGALSTPASQASVKRVPALEPASLLSSRTVTPNLIETVRVTNGTAPLWNLHLARLREGCGRLGIGFPTLVPPHGGGDRVCRYEIRPDGVGLSERQVGPVTPLRLVTARVPHKPYPLKTTDRACFAEARTEADSASAHDAVLLTSQGWVAEGTIWSLCWWEMNLLAAPALSLLILPGIGRARLKALRGHIVERRVTRRALSGVPVFLVNAARGVVEVESWDGEQVPRHPETARLAAQFWS
jgi:branched-subunit amino acid aminotransferase/4-amino-4-deoxychorismate lyase